MQDIPDTQDGHDDQTLAFYDQEAARYAARRAPQRNVRLDRFIAAMPAGGRVLDLGCGGGQDAAVLLKAGLDVQAVDGSPLLAAEAERCLGRPVRVMRFETLSEEGCYDGVWANASLLHVPLAALPDVIRRVWRALKPGGLLFASFKAGEAPGRDSLGRYFNFLSREALAATFAVAADWTALEIETGQGGGYDHVERLWLMAWGRR